MSHPDLLFPATGLHIRGKLQPPEAGSPTGGVFMPQDGVPLLAYRLPPSVPPTGQCLS